MSIPKDELIIRGAFSIPIFWHTISYRLKTFVIFQTKTLCGPGVVGCTDIQKDRQTLSQK